METERPVIQMSAPRKRFFKGEKKPFSIRLPEDLYEFINKTAEDAGRGIAEQIADAYRPSRGRR